MAGLRAGTDRHRGVVLLPELERRTHPPALGLGPLAPVIARLMPGQEERNADHPPGGRGGDPLQQPPGARLEDRPALDSPVRLTAMRANATSLARPPAARDIATTLIG
jgi:hypothetical protein